ncbi:MAG: uroporphyrinogen decarboxylase family protein [Deltaproteobacteria bacterium]|nr:uroporphyrinogen decarboxylase family protein [Deltaproteobacteria bacterium]MBN2670313.1 uroporphyrinogen decarboxylase family protein [Deltaproteobacteria bacterium]
MPDSMSLFGKLMNGELPSRVPVALNLFDQGQKELRLTSEQYYSRAENVVSGQLELRKKYGHDVVWGTHYVARQAEILGSRRTIFPTNGPPNVGDMVIKTHKDIETLQIPDDVTEHPSFTIQLDTIRMLKRELNGSAPVCAFQTGTFTLPSILMGIHAWMDLFLTGPPSLVDELLTKCSEYTIKTFSALKEAGATLVAYANPMVSTDFFSLPQITERCLPWVKRDMTRMGTDGLVYFCGGSRINGVLPEILKRTTIGAFLVHPQDDVAHAKALVGGKALVAGAINDIQLIRCTPEEARQSTKEIIEKGAPGGGFILSSLVMPFQIPTQNIHAVVDAAHQYGAYEAT